MTATAATLRRNPTTGRFAPRRTFPTCETCGSVLCEGIYGQLRCVRRRCEQYGAVVGRVAGVDMGTLTEGAE